MCLQGFFERCQNPLGTPGKTSQALLCILHIFIILKVTVQGILMGVSLRWFSTSIEHSRYTKIILQYYTTCQKCGFLFKSLGDFFLNLRKGTRIVSKHINYKLFTEVKHECKITRHIKFLRREETGALCFWMTNLNPKVLIFFFQARHEFLSFFSPEPSLYSLKMSLKPPQSLSASHWDFQELLKGKAKQWYTLVLRGG